MDRAGAAAGYVGRLLQRQRILWSVAAQLSQCPFPFCAIKRVPSDKSPAHRRSSCPSPNRGHRADPDRCLCPARNSNSSAVSVPRYPQTRIEQQLSLEHVAQTVAAVGQDEHPATPCRQCCCDEQTPAKAQPGSVGMGRRDRLRCACAGKQPPIRYSVDDQRSGAAVVLPEGLWIATQQMKQPHQRHCTNGDRFHGEQRNEKQQTAAKGKACPPRRQHIDNPATSNRSGKQAVHSVASTNTSVTVSDRRAMRSAKRLSALVWLRCRFVPAWWATGFGTAYSL